MDIIGIVAEYNPFHNGHLYQIEQIKKLSSRSAVIAIISGYFSQRGEPAIISPRSRAKMALKNGVDLVLQMPTYSAVGSAELFSETATRILDATGICKYLVFGSEQDKLEQLSAIASILIDQETELWNFIQEHLVTGISYAEAREAFIAEKINLQTAKLLRESNQILAIEYLKSIYKFKLNLKPWLIQRKGSAYLDQSLSCLLKDKAGDEQYASALAIRKLVAKQSVISGFPANLIEDLANAIPIKALAILLHDLAKHDCMNLENMSNLYYFALENSDFASTRYMSDALFNRLRKVIRFSNDQYPKLEKLIEQVTTKQLPTTRVQRSLTNLLLNIKERDDFEPSYIQVVGFNKQGRYLLRRMNKSAKLPIINNFSELSSVLKPKNIWQEHLELRASRIWLNSAQHSLNEIFESPIIV